MFISPFHRQPYSSSPLRWDTYQEVKASIPSYQLREEPEQDLHRGSTNMQVFTHLHSK